jgi:hypothetical protein
MSIVTQWGPSRSKTITWYDPAILGEIKVSYLKALRAGAGDIEVHGKRLRVGEGRSARSRPPGCRRGRFAAALLGGFSGQVDRLVFEERG